MNSKANFLKMCTLGKYCNYIFLIVAPFLLLGTMECKPPSAASNNVDWAYYGGDSGGSRYSALNQINLDNVDNLEIAWEYETEEIVDPERPIWNQCQPIVIDGILYATTSKQKLFALNAATGKRNWQFDPYEDSSLKPQYHAIRGLVYWTDGKERRILYSVGSFLLAIDAKTGKRIKSFGDNGKVDLHIGLGDEETLGYDVNQFGIRSTSPGVIYKDLIIMGSSVSEGGNALPGYIRAYNVKTGDLAWVFRTIPLPGEFGYDTWGKDSYKKLGGANCWAGMVVDQDRGRVFLGTGSPSVDFYGAARPGQNLFANCVISLDAETGERVWHFQTVHHDLWDKDIPSPPNLIQVKHEGKMVDAVAQATKDGFVYIFDRDTGKPLFPVEEIAVPTMPALPGEKPWPTQPRPLKPAPFARQTLSEKELTRRTPEAHNFVLERFKNSNHGSQYLPPSEKGSLYYGFGGGAEWGGAAVDPNGIFYVNGNNMLWWLQMKKVEAGSRENRISRGERLFNQNCAMCHANDSKTSANNAYPNLFEVGKRMDNTQILNLLESGRGRMPSFQHLKENDRAAIVKFLVESEKDVAFDVHKVEEVQAEDGSLFPYSPPYLNNGNSQFLDHEGYPALEPLWGTLNAIDMNSGEYLWQIPLGEFKELKEKGLITGSENHGGPIVTAGGLLFIGASYDENLKAYDRKNGKKVWEYLLPAGAFATPITYMVKGKQYVVVNAGGGRYGLKGGSKYLAFALPN